MKDRRLIVNTLVLLALAISLNQAQKVKTNERRTAGLVPYPRIGRNSEMTNFPRSDRAAGLVHYPRVGRAGPQSASIGRFQHDLELDGEADFYNAHDAEADGALDFDYEGHMDKPVRVGSWFIPEHVRGLKEYHPVQKIDDPRLLYADSRGPNNGPRSHNGQLMISSYTPRLGRGFERNAPSYP